MIHLPYSGKPSKSYKQQKRKNNNNNTHDDKWMRNVTTKRRYIK